MVAWRMCLGEIERCTMEACECSRKPSTSSYAAEDVQILIMPVRQRFS